MIRVVVVEGGELACFKGSKVRGMLSTGIVIANSVVVSIQWSEHPVEVALLVLVKSSSSVVLLFQLCKSHLIVDHGLVLDHGSFLLEIRSGVPAVSELRTVRHALSHDKTTESADIEAVSAEPSLSLAGLLDVGPVLNPSLVRDDGNSTLIPLSSGADHASNGPREDSADAEPSPVVDSGLEFHLLDVLEWNTLWVGHVLSWSQSEPLVCFDVVLEPKHLYQSTEPLTIAYTRVPYLYLAHQGSLVQGCSQLP